jgi:hypothetical protein
MTMTTHRAGHAPEVEHVHTVAIYRPHDGAVLHVHQVVVFKGGRQVTASEAEHEALRQAQRRGFDPTQIKLLQVGRHLPRGILRVENHKLVASPPPSPKR